MQYEGVLISLLQASLSQGSEPLRADEDYEGAERHNQEKTAFMQLKTVSA